MMRGHASSRLLVFGAAVKYFGALLGSAGHWQRLAATEYGGAELTGPPGLAWVRVGAGWVPDGCCQRYRTAPTS